MLWMDGYILHINSLRKKKWITDCNNWRKIFCAFFFCFERYHWVGKL